MSADGHEGHLPILVDKGFAYALFEGELVYCALPFGRPIPPLMAGHDGMAEYSIDDEWVCVHFDALDVDERATCERAQAFLAVYDKRLDESAERTSAAPGMRG